VRDTRFALFNFPNIRIYELKMSARMSPAPPSKKMVQLAMRFCPMLCQKWHNGMEMPVMPAISAIPSTPPLVTDCEVLRRALLIETSTLLMDLNDFASLHSLWINSHFHCPFSVNLGYISRAEKSAAYFWAKILENKSGGPL